MKSAFNIAFLFFLFSTNAQISETITVKAGEDLSAILSSHGLYKFPSFIYGTVLFKDGTSTKAKMNFNVFLNDMQFIDNKGDTLAIDNASLIDSLKLDSNVFYYQKGYFYIVKDYSDIKLVMQEKINFENVKKGAYGLPSRASSIDTYGGATSGFNSINQYILNEDIIVKKETTYRLAYKKFRSEPATRTGFLNVFHDIKKETSDFIETNNINFKRESDIKKLFDFCTQHL